MLSTVQDAFQPIPGLTNSMELTKKLTKSMPTRCLPQVLSKKLMVKERGRCLLEWDIFSGAYSIKKWGNSL